MTIKVPLNTTERKVLRLCALQHHPKNIAEKLQLSQGSIKNTLSAIYQKLNLNGMTALGFYYFLAV
ncbi:MAG: LuxR C-terminal-related transcriptional regulator [Deinococcales bacterium]